MKIIFICNEYPPRPHGGIGTFVNAFTHALAAKGHQITVIELGDQAAVRTADKVTIVTIPTIRLPFIGNIITRFRLRKWLSGEARKGMIDIIECPDYMGFLPFGVSNCPVVVRLHLSATSMMKFMGRRPSFGIHYYERRTLSVNQNWIAVSHFSLELTVKTFGFSPSHSALIYYPIAPTPAVLPQTPTLPARYILYAGTVSQRKGALVLAKAARDLLNKFVDLHVVYIGGISVESGRPISEEILAAVGPELENRILFLGHQNRDMVLSCMKKATVFAFPSKLETLGLVVLEAMECLVPVVCTNYPPGPELVVDGYTGLLADPSSPEDFKNKLTVILEDVAFGRLLATNARKVLADKFSMELCIEKTEKFYHQCINRG